MFAKPPRLRNASFFLCKFDILNFFTFDETPKGSGMNLRDLTDAFIFDPKDPIDLATAPLVAFPPAFAIARLAKLGIKLSIFKI